MNTIKIYLKASGSIAELVKHFALYKNAYQNKLVDVYVPKSVLYENQQGTFSNGVKIAGLLTADNGAEITTDSYYLDYLKEEVINGVEYAVYERHLPKELTVYSGNQTIVINVMSIDNTDVENPVVLQVITTQTATLVVQNSAYIGDETLVEPTKTEEFNARITTNKNRIDELNAEVSLIDAQVQQNTEDIARNRNAIDGINQTIATGQDFIGTLITQSFPTDSQLNEFVIEKRGVDPKNGDTIIVIEEVEGDTDRNYKFIFSSGIWNYYEIPPMEDAENGTHGIIEGTYGIGLNYNTLVDISGGRILNIYIKDNNGSYKNLRDYVNMNSQDISDIISGDTVVGEALKAVQDGFGNNIANTYLTQVLGATKQFVKDYAMPREFGNVYFISSDGYTTQVPTTPVDGVQFTVNTNAVGSFQLFSIEKTNEASFELTSINGYSNNLYISSNNTAEVQFRLITECRKQNESWRALNTELSNVIELRQDDIQRVQLNSPFIALGDTVLSLESGDKIRQRLEIVTQTSSMLTFRLYCNEIYPSTFTITSQSYLLEDIDKAKSQIIVIGADGVIQSGNVVMTVQDANSFIEYRTNQREFILNGNIPVVGTIDDIYPVRIEFGETVYNLYSFMKGGNTPLTFGDIASSTTYNSNTGYSFDIRVMFIETSDITGFVLSPATLTAEEVLNLISDDGTVIGSVGADNKLNLMLKTELQKRIMRALVTPTSAPTETELVGINVNNSQVNIQVGDGIKIENGVISKTEPTKLNTSNIAVVGSRSGNVTTYTNVSIPLSTLQEYTFIMFEVAVYSGTAQVGKQTGILKVSDLVINSETENDCDIITFYNPRQASIGYLVLRFFDNYFETIASFANPYLTDNKIATASDGVYITNIWGLK